jgi:hypothetical protein
VLLCIQTRLASNSWSSCLSLLSAGIRGVHHHTQPGEPFQSDTDSRSLMHGPGTRGD